MALRLSEGLGSALDDHRAWERKFYVDSGWAQAGACAPRVPAARAALGRLGAVAGGPTNWKNNLASHAANGIERLQERKIAAVNSRTVWITMHWCPELQGR